MQEERFRENYEKELQFGFRSSPGKMMRAWTY